MAALDRIAGLLMLGVLAVLLGTTGAGAEERPVAEVVSVAGTVWAEAPGGERRSLACGDVLRPGDVVGVDAGGRLGMLSGEIYTQLESDSRLALGLTDAGEPDLRLQAGRVRVLDAGEATTPPGAPYRLTALDAAASARGADTEAYLQAEKPGAYAIFCEWGEPVSVSRGDETLAAEPNQCVVSKPREALYRTPAHDDRIALAGPDACLAPVAAGPLADRFDPTDVALAPPPTGLLSPAPPAFNRQVCASPGSSCAGAPTTGLGIVVAPGPGGTIPGLP